MRSTGAERQRSQSGSIASKIRRLLTRSSYLPQESTKHGRRIAVSMIHSQVQEPSWRINEMSVTAIAAPATNEDTAFVRFWNEVLAPKFIRFKHILVDGLSQHSEAVFPSLPVRKGDRVLDVGCGFGDTALKLAELVGPTGEVVGIDCCDAFLDYARKAAAGHGNVSFVRGDAEIALP